MVPKSWMGFRMGVRRWNGLGAAGGTAAGEGLGLQDMSGAGEECWLQDGAAGAECEFKDAGGVEAAEGSVAEQWGPW